MSARSVELSSVDYQCLYRWLSVATKGLSDLARARIRQEVTDHFHEALEERLERGLPEEVAAGRAVENLGSPTAARRAFRRTYLTRLQAHMLRRFIEVPRPSSGWQMPRASSFRNANWDPDRDRRLRPYVALFFFAWTVLLMVLAARWSPPHFANFALLGLMASAGAVFVVVVPRLIRLGKNRTAVALGATSECVFYGAFLMAPMISQSEVSGLELWALSALALFFIVAYLPLLFKLSNETERAT